MKKEKFEKVLKKVVRKERNILFERRKGEVAISSSTDAMSITARIPASNEQEYTAVVDGKYMLDVLSLCTEDDVSFSPVEKGIRMRCGEISVLFVKKNEIVRPAPDCSGTQITDSSLKEKCLAVIHAASDNPSDAPMLRSVNIAGEPENTTVTALDGKRISRRQGSARNAFSVSVFAGDLKTICSFMNEEGQIFVSDRFLMYKDEETVAVCRILNDTYYNVDEIRSRIKCMYDFVCDRDRLLALVRLSAINGNDVNVFVKDGCISIESKGASMDADGSLPITVSRSLPDTAFRLSSQYLLQAVSSLHGDVRVSFFVSSSPVVISSADNPSQEEVLMPMIL